VDRRFAHVQARHVRGTGHYMAVHTDGVRRRRGLPGGGGRCGVRGRVARAGWGRRAVRRGRVPPRMDRRALTGLSEDHMWFEDRWMVVSLCDE
jgi:hypothetical protein